MFVDIHQHLIWQMDDGPQSPKETAHMIRRASEDGVGDVFATPHVTPGVGEFDVERYFDNLEAASEWLEKRDIPLRLHSGCEILYTDETQRMLKRGRVLTLNESKYVLVEFLPRDSLDRLMNAGRVLNNAGYIPIYAHIERYECLRKVEHVAKLKSLPDVRLQVNAHTVIESRSFFAARFIDTLFRERFVDYVATDSHNVTSRPTCMTECFNILSKKYGRPQATALTAGNQMELLYDD